MDFGNYLILICGGLIVLSIFAGLVSSRVGAPLLLVFLALGMLAGEDGPGGLAFDDFEAAYTIGAVSLAIVLFDGGLRTSLDTLWSASWPSLVLATIGVALTAAITGLAAHWLFDFGWIESFLVGSIVASTDAAAVFFLLHLHGTNLVKRLRATLEAESGLNDPMAVFLTVTFVELALSGGQPITWPLAGDLVLVFLLQIIGGGLIGVLGGHTLVELINRLKLASGLYPILALSGALVVFGSAQVLGASGFLAAYLCGIVVGNRRHRARQLIERFEDGIAWLSQIVMFVMLGLLVTPSQLLDHLGAAVATAFVLMFVARPAAVILCIAPFGFGWREHAFLSWVGLRGAVPIFLGTIPVLADLPDARTYFDVAFVVVLTSLLIQGWTVNLSARLLNIALPPDSGPLIRYDIDLPEDVGRDMAVFAVQEGSPVTRLPSLGAALGADVEAMAVIRDGAVRSPREVAPFAAGDQVLVFAPEDRLDDLNSLFGAAPPEDRKGRLVGVLGEFTFDAQVIIGDVARTYGFAVPATDSGLTVEAFLRRHFRNAPDVGDRFRIGPVELIVQEIDDGTISRFGIELDPQGSFLLSRDNLRVWRRFLVRRLGIKALFGKAKR